ncbi:MAG: helix-turn-helix domain-containing protein [Lachnospiraceae bacterium]|nr:helix-turn-helix domain-containing protein [Lachnospiraceae bacterium]
MLSSQILKTRVEELHSLTKVGLYVCDPDGRLLSSSAGDGIMPDNVGSDAVRSFAASPADSQTIGKVTLLKILDSDGDLIYVLLTEGESQTSYMVARIAAGELKLLNETSREKNDRNLFYQSLLLDNLLQVDILNRARKLRIENQKPRVVYVVDTRTEDDSTVTETLRGMFNVRTGDYVTAVDETTVILIRALSEETSDTDLSLTAQMIVDTIASEAMVDVRVGYGTVAHELREVSKSYKEAMMAIDVGKIFYASRKVNSYTSLGIGRLIYQIPQSQCEVFLNEVFRDLDPSTIDEEIVTTVYKFFENSLNVSETARQLFIHRNTLGYRIEKLKSLTGLDVRNFDDALTFVIAMMVYNRVESH